MKFLLLFIVINLSIGCASSGTTSSSAESQAKELTSQMQKSLNLSEDQTGKVLMINVVNFGLMEKLKEGESKMEVRAKYSSEMKKILNDTQYKLFVENFIK